MEHISEKVAAYRQFVLVLSKAQNPFASFFILKIEIIRYRIRYKKGGRPKEGQKTLSFD